MISESNLRKAAALLTQIDKSKARLAWLTGNAGNGNDVSRSKSRRKTKLTAKQTAARKNQGRYMAALRPLNKAERKTISKLRNEKGVHVAITEAKKLAATA